MPTGFAPETAYYLNKSPPILAIVGKGVRFPHGHWIRVADGTAVAWHVEQLIHDLFPALRYTTVPFRVLLTEFDVVEFEREPLKAG